MGKSTNQVIHTMELPGQWATVKLLDLIDIPDILVTDDIDVRRYPSSAGGGEYIDAKTVVTVTRLVKGIDEPEVNNSVEGTEDEKRISETQKILSDYLALPTHTRIKVMDLVGFDWRNNGGWTSIEITQKFLQFVKDKNYLFYLRDCVNEMSTDPTIGLPQSSKDNISEAYFQLAIHQKMSITSNMGYTNRLKNMSVYDNEFINYVRINNLWYRLDHFLSPYKEREAYFTQGKGKTRN